jgi:hypothetical protein
VTGALVPTGEVTVCCGTHHPAPGEASVCECCPECPTNARYRRFSPVVRRAVASVERCAWQVRRRGLRRVEHALAVEAMWDAVRCGESPLAGGFPPVQGRLT